MGLEVSWNLKAREADRTRRGTKTVGRYERVLWGSQKQTRDKDSRANRLFGVGGGDGRTCGTGKKAGRPGVGTVQGLAGVPQSDHGEPTLERRRLGVLPGVPRGRRLVEALPGALGPALSTGQLR